ncbi:hypothetical protein [Streptococcus acidominimus]|uniref:Uncharacterized protein n=1 Tax=Streptococcus acidominimus TaxID=1326 RepID=A0A1Q8E7J1_STRAI|nr:hypothetical protein [Streptococcus acidominimus]MBF0847601.1 hypothetical protein [Streptococcus danieliae]MBF0819751.1 hypothetical protein [Streptococcus acidominimus]MBF0839259.1 hypothetical protein [Streptococcus acidominimus]OLF47779.1 hypothetical protein BU200_10060 [Streptococcus acidominimus]TFU29493.1 hypothetical protein E4U01_09860 [Streptococcus acidominimus]
MTKIQDYARKIIFILDNNYSNQIEFSGIINHLYNLMMEIVSQDDSISLDIPSLIRQFVDETMDYNSSIIIYLEKMDQEIKNARRYKN